MLGKLQLTMLMGRKKKENISRETRRLGFEYNPLPNSATHIRLVQINRQPQNGNISCDLISVPLAKAPPYRALSYTWGNESVQHQILINKRTFTVAKNLYDFLCAESHRSDEVKPFWIDAICINQQDNAEKEQQVWAMGDIYKNAESTTIWLSKWNGHAGFAQVEPALDLLNYAEAHFGEPSVAKKFHTLFGEHEAGLFNALNALFQHPYWSRAWIIQEVLLAKQIYVRCGTQQITWDALEFWSWNFINIYSAIGIPLAREHSSMYRGCVDEFFAQRSSQQRERDQFATLSKLIKRYREKLCKEPRDHIFSLISLVDPEKHPGGPMLAPNYRDPWTEVFFETLAFLQRESEYLVVQTEFVELLLSVLYEGEFQYGRADSIFGECFNSPKWPHFTCHYAGTATEVYNEDKDAQSAYGTTALRFKVHDDRRDEQDTTDLAEVLPHWPYFHFDTDREYSDEHTGLAQSTIQVGDQIYLFGGTTLAIVVRPSGESSELKIVGKAVVWNRTDPPWDAFLQSRIWSGSQSFLRSQWDAANVKLIRQGDFHTPAWKITPKITIALSRRDALWLFREYRVSYGS